ncbi:hypothetical protein A4A49_21173 [Nicotiana attenuata]|uniref:Uncharacterized protein n=1 Tax=Nicotiana attenuata TaxID=49451 RepID=A0A1J6IPY5_NICAT|nr:hypothetical protein A4A49_21173 [Nicotiana attenuata]
MAADLYQTDLRGCPAKIRVAPMPNTTLDTFNHHSLFIRHIKCSLGNMFCLFPNTKNKCFSENIFLHTKHTQYFLQQIEAQICCYDKAKEKPTTPWLQHQLHVRGKSLNSQSQAIQTCHAKIRIGSSQCQIS